MQTKDIKDSINQLQKNKLDILEQKYEYLNNLNYDQQIAATSINGNILVLAGPGSGKTHTLVFRIIHMINIGINPQDIVLITFTRKAANEIKERVNRLVGNIKIGFIGTFHAFAIHLSNMYQINKGWRILDSEDDLVLLKMVITENNVKFDSKITNKTVLKIMSYSTNTRLSIEQSLVKMGREDLRPELKKLELVKKYYNSYKKRNKYLSYDDIIDSIVFKAKECSKYLYLMVDEYQDTNQMQLEFIQSLEIDNVMAIGDDFQGIYSFRGADPNIILNFYNNFKNSKLIILKTNYRSYKNIVTILNKVTDQAKIGFSKELKSNSKKKGEVLIEKIPIDYSKQIINYHKNHPQERTAFIYRANRDKTELEKELIVNKIDYVVYGGIRLLERKHIKDIFAFLLVNKNKNDLISYLRILLLLDGVGEKTAKAYLDDDQSKLSDRRDIVELEKILESKKNFNQFIEHVITFYNKLSKPKKNCNYTNEELTYDFNLVKELASEFEDPINFINDIVLNGSIDLYSNNNSSSKLILTTIHSAKGLEFDNVFHLYSRAMYSGYDIEQLEENRRLFYVAISRAKKRLVIWGFTYLDDICFDDILNDFKNYYCNNSEQLKFNYEDYQKSERTQLTNKKQLRYSLPESSHKAVNKILNKIFGKKQ
ncbi:MAG: ATP-dependent helicase [Mycoplasmatales bacterium]